MGLGYKVGRTLGRNKVATALAVIALVGFIVANNRSNAAAEASAAAIAKAEQAEKLARQKEAEDQKLAALKEKCTTGAAPLIADAKKLLAAGKPDQATTTLAPCRMVDASAEVRALITKASDAEHAQVVKVAAAQAAAEKAKRKKEGVSVGMSKQDVLDSSWGRPSKVNTTTSKYGTREQWVYGSGGYLYFEDGTLTTIQN